MNLFYKKVLADELLKPFFNETNMEKQHKMQKTFLSYAFGGPVKYNGKGMFAAHAKARKDGLKEKHFNQVAKHLSDTLQDLKVPQTEIDEVLTIAGSVKDDILGTKKEAKDSKESAAK